VLEDEGVIRKQLTRLLERQNYEVAGASNVEEALQLNPESFDLILADIRLPGRDGNDILKYSEQVPVIMMTSFASVRSAVESMKFGATNYISKPFDHDELLRTMEHALRETRSLIFGTSNLTICLSIFRANVEPVKSCWLGYVMRVVIATAGHWFLLIFQCMNQQTWKN